MFEINQILKISKAIVENCQNIFQVGIDKHKVSETEEGKQLQSLINQRSEKQMKFYIKNGRSAVYNKVKLMFLGKFVNEFGRETG